MTTHSDPSSLDDAAAGDGDVSSPEPSGETSEIPPGSSSFQSSTTGDPAASADSGADPAAAEESKHAPPDDPGQGQPRPMRRIRIGSQRPGSKPVLLDREPHRVPEPSQSAATATGAVLPGETVSNTTLPVAPAQSAGAQPTATQSTATQSTATQSIGVEPLAADAGIRETTSVGPKTEERGSGHGASGREPRAPAARKPGRGAGNRRRGDDRDAAEVAAAEPDFSSRPNVPRPSVRQPLSAELEQELAEALGNSSLDDLLDPVGGGSTEAELEPGASLTGRVVSAHREALFLDLGGRRQGVLSLAAFAGAAEETPFPEPGVLVQVTVSRYNADDGLYEVSLAGGATAIEDWSQVSEGMVVEARVTGHNTGGLECDVSHLRAFMPASQISLYRVENLAEMVDQRLISLVTEVNPDRRRLVLSRRAILEREKAAAREALLGQLEVGQTREAIVRSLRDFGAFVDLGGVDGLIHISQLSWDRIKHASEVLEEGQKVKVRIQKIDPTTGKISLAFRDLSESPWSGVAGRYPTRSKARGVVSRIMDFGAFVKLEPGVEGLIHISELSHKRVFRVSDVLQEGQEVEVQIQSVDPEQQRIGLSLKALETRAEPAKKIEEPEDEPVSAENARSKRSKPLQGGVGRSTGGERFGLKW